MLLLCRSRDSFVVATTASLSAVKNIFAEAKPGGSKQKHREPLNLIKGEGCNKEFHVEMNWVWHLNVLLPNA